MERRESSRTVAVNVNCFNHYEQGTLCRSLKKLKIELPYDPAIPFLGIYSEKTIIQENVCTPVFTGALVTVTEMKSTYMSIHRSTDKADVVHIYSGMLLSHKKDQNSAS